MSDDSVHPDPTTANASAKSGDSDDRIARLLLGRIGEPGDVALARAMHDLGAVETVRRLRAGTLTHQGLVNLRARLNVARPDRDLDAGALVGARFVIPGDEEWPDQVDDLVRLGRRDAGVPLGLWVRGPLNLRAACERSVAVVGARASTAYGDYVASEFGIGLAERSWTVVSGGAFGIDGAAHRGALAGDGRPSPYSPAGSTLPIHAGHAALIDRIAQTGLVVSEWPPGCAPMRYRFLVRNRVIAALTIGTVVVEAAIRSGALSTANRARELNRHIMAVPGPITSAMSKGTNQLLREPDVRCVTSVADVIDLVGLMGSDLAPPLMIAIDPRDDLDDVSRRVLESVPVRRAAGPASIAVTAGIAPQQVLRCLGGLAARGFVERVDAGWRLRRCRRPFSVASSYKIAVGSRNRAGVGCCGASGRRYLTLRLRPATVQRCPTLRTCSLPSSSTSGSSAVCPSTRFGHIPPTSGVCYTMRTVWVDREWAISTSVFCAAGWPS